MLDKTWPVSLTNLLDSVSSPGVMNAQWPRQGPALNWHRLKTERHVRLKLTPNESHAVYHFGGVAHIPTPGLTRLLLGPLLRFLRFLIQQNRICT